MSKRDDTTILEDIRVAVDRILTYSQELEYDDFVTDIKTQDAIIRNIEILGEAAKLLSEKTKEKYPNVPWKDIAGTRDKLIHDYFGVNIDVVWSIVRNDIPLLKEEIEKTDGEQAVSRTADHPTQSYG
jgi:uncharacterized protein with HEPN domain